MELLGDIRPQEVDAREWASGLTADLATPSLFGEPRALLVVGCRALPKEALAELTAYLADPAPDALLVLTAEVPERGKVPAALAKVVGSGVVRQVAVARKDLSAWVLSRGSRAGVTLGPDAAKALVEVVGESAAALHGAVEQLRSAFPGQRVTREHVLSQFRGLGEQRVWDLCDRTFERDLAGAVRSLRSLLENREEPLVVLGSLAARLRDLIAVKSLPERAAPEEVKQAVGLRFEWQARRYREQARRFDLAELVAAHARVVDADRALKSGGTGDTVLVALLASIAGRAEAATA